MPRCLIPGDFAQGGSNIVPVGDQDNVIIDYGFKNGLYVVTRDRWQEQKKPLFRLRSKAENEHIGTNSSDRAGLLALAAPSLRAFRLKIAFSLAAFQNT